MVYRVYPNGGDNKVAGKIGRGKIVAENWSQGNFAAGNFSRARINGTELLVQITTRRPQYSNMSINNINLLRK